MLFDRKVFSLALIIWFGCFSGTYYFSGISLYPPLILSLFGYYYIFFSFKEIPKYSVFFIIILFFYIVMFSLSYLFNQSYENILFLEMRYILKAFIIPLGFSFFVLSLLVKWNVSLINISCSVVVVGGLQLCLSILQLSFPSFREQYFSFIQLAPAWQHFVDIGHFRTIGLAGLSIYDTSIAYSLLFGSTLYLLRLNKVSIWAFGVVSFFILILLSGRTGLMFYLCLMSFIILKTKSKFKIYLILSVMIMFSITLANIYVDKDELSSFYKFAFEFFNNSSGNYESASTNDLLKNHLFIPWDTNVFFGDHVWAQPSISNSINYGYSTDSGYILSYISMGFGGLIVSIILTKKVIEAYLVAYSDYFSKDWMSFVYIILITGIVFFIILKGPIFFSEKFMSVLMIIFMIDFYKKRLL